MLNERKLTDKELKQREQSILALKKNKRSLVKKYGKDAEKVMYGIATKQAKSKVEEMNKEKLKGMIEDALKNPKAADLNKDGKLSSYEKKRGAAIEKNLNESLNPEVTKALNRFIKAMAKRYDYSEQDAVYAIMASLKQRDFDGINESKLRLKEGEGTTLTLSQSDMDKLHKDGKLNIDGHSIIYKTTMSEEDNREDDELIPEELANKYAGSPFFGLEERVGKVDSVLEEKKLNHDLKVKATQIIKNTLKKEGGAAGLKPLVKAVKDLGITKSDLVKLLKSTAKVEKHTEGDYILTPINE